MIRRVVITGMGVVSPLGCRLASFWQALCDGRCGFGPLTRFPAKAFKFQQAGGVNDELLPPPDAAGTPLDPANRFMLAAAGEAMDNAGFNEPLNEGAAFEAGLVLATNFGAVSQAEPLMAHTLNLEPEQAIAFDEYGFQRCADQVAHRWNLSGPRTVLSLSCSSGTAALAYGAELIRTGRAANHDQDGDSAVRSKP